MDQIKFNFDDNFQQGILQLMTQDSHFCQKAIIYVRPEYFKNSYYGYFFKTFKLLSEKYERIDDLHVQNELLKFDEEDQEKYQRIFGDIQNSQGVPRDFQYIRDNLKKFIQKATVWHINQKLVKAQHKDPDELFQMIQKDISESALVNFEEDDSITFGDLRKAMKESAESVGLLLPLGIPDIDAALGGGIERETLTLALGGTNVGKSIFLINVCYHWLMKGFKVIYLNLEGRKIQTILRLGSRALHIPYGRIRNNNLTDEEWERFNNFKKQYGDNLRIKHIAEFGYTVEEFKAYLKDLHKEFQFDGIIVDYGQILQTKEGFKDIRHRQAHVHQCLDGLASMFKAACITVAQGNRDAQAKNDEGYRLLKKEDISECFEITRKSATILTLNRSIKDEQGERVRILLDKQRDGIKGIVANCKTNMSYIAYYGDEDEGLGFLTNEQYKDDSLDIPHYEPEKPKEVESSNAGHEAISKG